MKEKEVKTEVILESISIEHVNVGDIIYISEDVDGDAYKVLDCGNPFILIQNQKTRFAAIYEPDNNLYKKIIKKC